MLLQNPDILPESNILNPVRDGDIGTIPSSWHQWRHHRRVQWPEPKKRRVYNLVDLDKHCLGLIETMWQEFHTPHWDVAVSSNNFPASIARFGMRCNPSSVREYERVCVNGHDICTRKLDLTPRHSTTHRFVGVDFTTIGVCRLHAINSPMESAPCKCKHIVCYGEVICLLSHTLSFNDPVSRSLKSETMDLAIVRWFSYVSKRHTHTGLPEVGPQDSISAVPLNLVRNLVFVVSIKTIIDYNFDTLDRDGRQSNSLVIDFSRTHLLPD